MNIEKVNELVATAFYAQYKQEMINITPMSYLEYSLNFDRAWITESIVKAIRSLTSVNIETAIRILLSDKDYPEKLNLIKVYEHGNI